MITLTLKPLTDNYKVIVTRVTEIEKSIYPPMYEQTNGDRREEIFKDWHTLWTVVQSYIMNHNTLDPLLLLFWWQLTEYEWLNKISDITFEDNWENLSWVDCISISNKFFLRIEYGEYCLILSWENDCICYDEHKGYYMSDVKFVKARRKNLDGKMQCFFYPMMFNLTRWSEDDVTFEYWCFIKNKKKPVLDRLTSVYKHHEFIEELPNYLDTFIRQNADKFISWDEHRWNSMTQELWSKDDSNTRTIRVGHRNNTILGEREEAE